MMQELLQDLRYGARMLLKNPSFTLIAVITLALGIGANTAIFSVVNAVLLRPLPYPEADRLLTIGQQYKSGLMGAGEPKFLFWREHNQSFDSMTAYSGVGGASGNLSSGSEAEHVNGLRVSEDFFRVHGVYPMIGRAFTKEEDAPGAERAAILSYGLWQRRFGGDAGLIGKTVLLNDRTVTVVGVMPPQFRLISGIDLYVPMQAKPTANYDPNATVVGRLKPGVTREQALAELKTIADQYRAAFPKQMQESESIGVQRYQETFTDGVDRSLWILLGAVVFLLLIACANVANLQLTRAAGRQREIAVRMAMGANGGRIARQLLTEGLLLAVIGGAAGVLMAVWGTELLISTLPGGFLPSIAEIDVDWRVLVFAFVATLLTGLLFALAPAWRARKIDVNAALKENAGKGGTGRERLRGALVVAEVALSITLLVGAGLLIRSFANLLNVTPGFDPRNVLTFKVALEGDRYKTSAQTTAFYRETLQRIERLPGVEAAAITNKLPLDWQFNMPVVFPEQPDNFQSVQFRMISADYFRVMKIPIRQGREFDAADNLAGQPVALVNEAFARRYFGAQNPLSRQLSIGRGLGDPLRQVVGIVGDVKQNGLDSPAPAMVFIPSEQTPDKLMGVIRAFTPTTFAVRTTVDPAILRESIKRELAGVDATISASEIFSMEEIAGKSIAPQRFYMLLLGLFAALGLLLAGVGVYGVMSYVVSQRTQEIGLRIALGAQSRDVLAMILKRGLILALIGVAIGVSASFGLTRLMSGFLFGVTPTDPLTFIAISVLLLSVVTIACWLPARRAAKVDPMVALRHE